jgi:hypothetical protein
LVAQIQERYKRLHPRYKAKIGQQYFSHYEPTQSKDIRSKTCPASASEALHVCKNVPSWGLQSIKGEDITPGEQQNLTARRDIIWKEITTMKGKIKRLRKEG